MKFKRKMRGNPAQGYGEVFAMVVDLYESKGSLDAFDPVTREEIEDTFHLLLQKMQQRRGVREYYHRPTETTSRD